MQFFTGIEIDGSSLGRASVLGYEQTVWGILADISRVQAGRAVLRPFRNSDLVRPLRIVPWNRPGHAEAQAQYSNRLDQALNAFPAGEPIPDARPAHRGEIVGIGTGVGLHTHVRYTPNTLHTTGPGGRRDEVLVHEIVHAIRFLRGLNVSYSLGHHFNNWEEFYSVLVANIYSSELQRLLRADHRGRWVGGSYVTNRMNSGEAAPGAYDQEYSNLIRRFVQDDPVLSRDLAAVPSSFNPIRDHFARA